MKKLLLSGIAALLLATGAAHARLAQAATIELPSDMLGYWCPSHAPLDDPDQDASVLKQAKNFDDCGNHGGRSASVAKLAIVGVWLLLSGS